MMQITGVGWAEIRKLLSRPVARFGLVFSVLLGAFGPFVVLSLSNIPMRVGSEPVQVDYCVANGLDWALAVRHWSWSAQLLIVVLAAVSYAGELQSHTLREDLVRPVDRWLVLLAKWGSLSAWSMLSLLLQFATGGLVGLVLLGAQGKQTMAHVISAYAVSLPVELSFAAVALAAAVVLRTVPGTVVAMVLFVVFERGFTWMSMAARSFFFESGNLSYVYFTPTSAWSVWSEMISGAPPSWQPWLALLVWTVLAISVALVSFARTDVP